MPRLRNEVEPDGLGILLRQWQVLSPSSARWGWRIKRDGDGRGGRKENCKIESGGEQQREGE